MTTHQKKCPVDVLLRVMSGSWTSYIIYVLSTEGPHRFGVLQRRLGGISTKVLTERLRMLERADLVDRDVVPTIPPQVTYSLTGRGMELSGIMQAIGNQALIWRNEGWTPDGPAAEDVTSAPAGCAAP